MAWSQPTLQRARRTRSAAGFSLLEVLLAIALLGSGIIALLVVRSNCIDNAADTIRLRSVRLLVARHAGHHLAYQCDPARTPALDDWQEDFPEYVVDAQVQELPLEDLLPDELRLVAQPKDHGGEPGSGGTPPAEGSESKTPPVQLRRLVLNVAPPGAEDDPDLTVRIVTFKLVPPPKDPPAGTPKASFPEYPRPLVGPDAAPTTDPNDPNAPEGNPEGEAPPAGG